MDVAVVGGGLGLVVGAQGDERESAVPAEHASRFGQDAPRGRSLRQDVEQHDDIERSIRECKVVHVAHLHPRILRLRQPRGGRFNHLGVAVEASDAPCSGRYELRNGAIAAPEVEHVAQIHQSEKTASHALPGATWRVMPIHLARHRIGPRYASGTRLEDTRAALAIAVDDRVLELLGKKRPDTPSFGRHISLIQGVEGGCTDPSVAKEASVAKLCEVRGNARLANLRDVDELGHRKLLLA
jgi:hypothetical protein